MYIIVITIRHWMILVQACVITFNIQRLTTELYNIFFYKFPTKNKYIRYYCDVPINCWNVQLISVCINCKHTDARVDILLYCIIVSLYCNVKQYLLMSHAHIICKTIIYRQRRVYYRALVVNKTHSRARYFIRCGFRSVVFYINFIILLL